MALTKIPSNLITLDAIDGTLIADDAINSEHIADGAIDAAHMSANSIDSDSYVDGSIDTAHIGDDQVTVDKLADSINTSIAAKLPLAGGTMTGAITGNLIGNVTGNVTGNTSGTALTVTQAAQTAITSVGTLTGLTVAVGSDSDSVATITSSASGNNTQLRLGTSGNNSVISGTGGSTGGLVLKTYGTAAITVDASQNTTLAGTLGVTGAITGTLATAAQTAITSVGTLTGLSTTGDVTVTKSSAAVAAIESGGATTKLVAGGSTGYIGTYSNHALQILTNSTPAITVDASQNTTLAGTLTVDGGGSRQYINSGHVRLSDDYNLEWGGGTNYIRGSNSSGDMSLIATGDLTLDVAGEIHLDSDSEIIRIRHDAGDIGMIQMTSNDLILRSMVSDKDLIFKGNDSDGGGVITALTLDMSDAGTATFNHDVNITGTTIASENIRIRGGASTPISGEARLGGHVQWGAQIYGYGSSNDVSLVNRAGTVAMAVLANTTNITMAGTLGVTGAVTSGSNTDTVSVFGRTAIGFVSGLSDYAFFSHYDRQSSSNYALVQSASGSTYLNGTDLNLSIGGTRKVVVDSSGNVGIGTTSPGANGSESPALDVMQSTTGAKAAAYMRVTASTNAAYNGESFYTGHYRDTGNGEYCTVGMIGMETVRAGANDVAGDLNFYTKVAGGANTAAPTQKMVIKADGKVGIATPAPTAMLDINSLSTSLYALKIRGNIDNDGGYTGITFGYEGDTTAYEKVRLRVEGTSGNVQPEFHILVDQDNSSSSAEKADAVISVVSNTQSEKMVVINAGKQGSAYDVDFPTSGEVMLVQGPLAVGEATSGSTGTAAGRWIHQWAHCGAAGAGNYSHYKTQMWGGGSPSGNTAYIMGGFWIRGYQYGSGNCFAIHQFHNWAGTLYNHHVSDLGSLTGVTHCYVSSDGWVTLRLDTRASYKIFDVDFVQYAQYGKVDASIRSLTQSSSATI